MVTGWIVYPRPATRQQAKNNAHRMMAEAAARFGIRLSVVYAEDLILCAGETLSLLRADLPRFVLMRCYDHHLAAHLETMGIRVFNTAASMAAAEDKFRTHQLLAAAGIPTPKSFWNIPDYETASRLLGNREMILKSPRGSKGEAVFLVRNAAEYEAHPGCLVQEYIAGSSGRDVRVWVVGEQAFAAVLRHNGHSFRSNYAQGGSADPWPLDEETAGLAVRSSRAAGLEISGVDLLFLPDGGWAVCEVNGNAGFRTLWNTAPEKKLPLEIFRHISERIEK